MNNTFLKKTSLIKTALIKASIFGALVFSAQLAFAVPAGSVTFKSGDATITHADNTVVPAEKSASLNEGDTIETKDGRVQLAFIDGGKVSLQPNTIYKINKFAFSGKEDGTEYNFTELVKGGLRTISGLIGHKNRSHYQVKTVVATIGIRGTEYTANFDTALTMTTNHGSVDVCGLTGDCLNALTGQTIVVAAGSSPKFSSKQATISAAPPPASGKPVFVTAEQVHVAELVAVATSAGNTNIGNTGSDTILSLAAMASGPDQNGIYLGTATFNNDNLTTYVDNPSINQNKTIVTGTIIEATSDSFIKWGRASGGTFNAQNMVMTSWITGTATPTLVLANLSAFYNVTNSTAPYIVNNGSVTAVGASDSVTGSMYLNFSALKWGYNLSIPVPGQAFNLSVANNILGVGGSPLTAGVNELSSDNATIIGISTCGCVVAGVTGTGLLPNGANNNAVVQGALFGANAERAGLEYGINLSGLGISGGGGNLYGAVVLTKQ